MITKHGKPVAALIPYEDWEMFAAAKAGGLASVPSPADNHDAEIDALIDALYEARARARARKPSL